MIKRLLITFLLFLFGISLYSQDILNLSEQGIFYSSGNMKFKVNGSVNISSDATLTQNSGDSAIISLDFINDGTLTANSGVFLFNGNATQTIGGISDSEFNHLSVNKTGGRVELDGNIKVDSNLRILSNTLFDIKDDTLTIGQFGDIFTNNVSAKNFSDIRNIFNSIGQDGGFLKKEIPSTASLPYNYRFPLGTNSDTGSVYTWADITLLLGKVVIGSDAYIQVKAVPEEHPQLEITNNALKKYWVIDYDNLDIDDEGVNLLFRYRQIEVTTNEGNYEVLYYQPSYPDLSGFWSINPGASNQVVDFNANLIYSEQIETLAGDWTAGIAEAAFATYYSRADGDFDDPNTWSKIAFGGPASPTAPNNVSDKVRIRDHEVTIVNNTTSVNIISVEENATLRFVDEAYASGDTLRIEDEATLVITSIDGVNSIDNTGNVRTTIRDFSEDAFYYYAGSNTPQMTGDGLPTNIRTLIIDKDNESNIVELSKFFSIKDSLVINEGTLDLGSYSINGLTANRSIVMRGGELRIRNAFPTNYTSPYFTAGRVNFFGTGSVTIPSHNSTPPVEQYNNLKISGNRIANITLASTGQIRVKDSLDLSDLSFDNTSLKFNTTGSTVVFNKFGGIQDIPTRPSSPNDSLTYLQYNNLILDSTGVKRLNDFGNPTFIVLGDLTLRNTAEFQLNGYNLEIRKNWLNQTAGSIFVPGNNRVIFRSPTPLQTNTITSRDTTENPFYDIVFAGRGIVRPLDLLHVRRNLTIDSNATLRQENSEIVLKGNWNNYFGTYSTSNANLYFRGDALQTVTKATGNETFDNVFIQNANHVDISQVGTTATNGLDIKSDLNLEIGNLISRGRRATALGSVTRPGVNPGHIDGPLWKTIDTLIATTIYEVGYLDTYTPVELSFNQQGGTRGLISVESDTITAVSSPISNGLNPAGSEISDDKNVRRQWKITRPSSSTFSIGLRNYNAKVNFVGNAAPNGDLRNGADPLVFESRLWNGSSWIEPSGSAPPYIGDRNINDFTFDTLNQFGTIIIGDPEYFTFYSLNDGNWTNPSSWSTQKYGGEVSLIAPIQDDRVFIGDNKTITLNTNYSTDRLVNVDSTGFLRTENNIISGTGEFRLRQFGTLGIGNASGILVSGANGNIQTTTRNYNFNNHNRGIYRYTGGVNQSVGNGLPTNIYRLIVDKSSNNLNFNITGRTVLDSLHIIGGTLNQTANLNIQGNLRHSSAAGFLANSSTIDFVGDSIQYIRSELVDSLVFYNLRVNKPNGKVYLDTNTRIRVNNNLDFLASNTAVINSRLPNTFVIAAGNVNRSGDGHIDGELIKNIPSGDAPAITYEVGDSTYYSPYLIDMRSGSGSIAGFVSVNVFPFDYPYMNDTPVLDTVPPIYPERIVHRFWRLSRPAWSTFERGTRNFDVRAEYVDPDDWDQLDDYSCADFAINTYFDDVTRDTVKWESVWPSNGGICTDTRDMSRTPSFSNTSGNGSESYLVFTRVNDVTKPWGDSKILDNGNLLFGDFVLGNQNGKANFITFFSRQSGDWTDPNTWSTVSHLSAINNSATLSPTINFRGFPLRQYDNVVIDSNHKVTLDATIGLGEYTAIGSPFRYLAKVGPNTVVKKKGVLDLNIFELRGNAFRVEKGGTLIIGAKDGVSATSPAATRGLGNLKGYARVINDSTNLIYTALADMPNLPNRSFPYYHNYCSINMTNNSRYIERVTIRDASNNVIMENNTGDSLINILCFLDHVAEFEVGQTYSIEVERESSSNTRRLRVFIDWDRDGFYNQSDELVISQNFPNKTQSGSFVVPNITEGYTQMRVMYRSNTSTDPCVGNAGEVEDYSIVIRNPSTSFAQIPGTLIPNNVSSLTFDAQKENSSLTLQKDITIFDSLHIKSGILNGNGNDFVLTGNVRNDTLNGLNQGSGEFSFVGGRNQAITGTESITFTNVIIDKDTNKINVSTSTRIDNNLDFVSNTRLSLITNDSLIFSPNATLTPGAGSFNVDKAIEVIGLNPNNAFVTKEFTTTAGSKEFYYPFVNDTIFNPANIDLTGTYSGTPSITLQLFAEKHPDRLNDNVLNKYWDLRISDITSITSSNFEFHYAIDDTSGDGEKYIPGLYNTDNTWLWEINLGDFPKANPSPIEITDTEFIEGAWTAGEATTFFIGRNFYSLNTGNWDNHLNWSNESHTGSVSSYYPGEIYDKDTVFIDGHIITFNTDTATVDSIKIGGAFAGISPAGRGVLTFGASPLNKYLQINGTLTLEEDGRLESVNQSNRYDTLVVFKDIINNGLNANNAGIDLYNAADDKVNLYLRGNTDSYVAGNGYWEELAEVYLDKEDGLNDTLFINSSTFGSASDGFTDYRINLESGVLKHYNPYAATISSDGNNIDMKADAGIVVTDGDLNTKSTLTTFVKNEIRIDGGNLNIGDAQNKNLIFQDSTSLILDGGNLIVGGVLNGENSNSKLVLDISNNSELSVLRYGNTDASKVGIELISGSTLNMNSGVIKVIGSTAGAPFDYNINATEGIGMTGGVVQLGDSVITPGGTIIKVGGLTPIHDLHVVGANVEARQIGNKITVNNDFEIDDDATYNVLTNHISVGGNVTNYGVFDASNGSLADTRLLELDGTGDQTIFNEDAPGLNLFNFRVNKTSGNVLLSGSGNSNIIVNSTLEFTNQNNALIDASANSFNQYIEVSPAGGSNPSVLRNGKGHVHGRMYRHFNSGPTNRRFFVGADSIDSYRPADITTVGTGGTAGLIGVAHYGVNHQQIDSTLIDENKNIEKYWNVDFNGYSLGASQTYNLRLKFLNPADLRGGATTNFFEQFLYDPPCPNPPALCPDGTGTWYELTTLSRTDTTITSTNNTLSGDVIISEPAGLTYYSIADGFWRVASNWSTQGYGGAPASKYPDLTSDIARIGDGKKITVQGGIAHEPVRIIIVEEFNNDPGELEIEGTIGNVKSDQFIINDNCFLTFANVGGIANNPVQGAIQAASKSFGVANYKLIAESASQITGNGFPDTVASIKILLNDPTESVFTTNFAGAPIMKVRDSIIVESGNFESGNRNYRLYGDFNIYQNGEWLPLLGNFRFDGGNQKNINLGNNSGISFYDLDIYGGDISLNKLATAGADVNMIIEDNLAILDTTIVRGRTDSVRVIIDDAATVTRTGTGFIDGTMQRYYSANSDTNFFYIGYEDTYTPIELSLDNGINGVAGGVDGTAYEPTDDTPFWGNRLKIANKINRFWRLVPGDADFDLGERLANTQIFFPSSELAAVNTAEAVVRRNAILPPQTYDWYERRASDLVWDVGNADVKISDTELWTGLGDFYIGEKARRVFYSISDGDWTNNGTWAFDPAGTILAPPGTFPNNDPTELVDSVIVRNDDEVFLDTETIVSYLQVTGNSTFIIDSGSYVSQSPVEASFLDIDNGTINNKSNLGIQSDTSISIFRFDDFSFDNDINFIFSGYEPQVFGDDFPNTIGSLTLSNTGGTGNNTIAMDNQNYEVTGDITVNTGELRHTATGNSLTIGGSIIANDNFDMTLDTAGNTICSSVIFNGDGVDDQFLVSTDTLRFCDVSMDRGPGSGIVVSTSPVLVSGVFDLQEGANPNSQIYELGIGGDLIITNDDSNAMVGGNEGPVRYIRTSQNGGSLCRAVTTSSTYEFPVGSQEGGQDIYAPAIFNTDPTGDDGNICLKSNAGTNPTYTDAHLHVSDQTTDWIGRYWEINNVTTTITGQMDFIYNDLDINGSEANYTGIGNWSEPSEGTPGFWTLQTSGINTGANTFSTPANFNPADLFGDWTLANMAAFRRIFYSRQTGVWDDENTWTANSSHTGPIFGIGLFPNDALDSVVVGGGVAGVGNHIVELNVAPNVTIGGLALGTGSNNTGTLLAGENIIIGDYFTMGNLSTLGIGSSDGITSVAALGNIQTTGSRYFGGDSIRTSFIYNGSVSQSVGNALPDTVQNLTIENSGVVPNSTVTLLQNTQIFGNLSVLQGRLDLADFTANSFNGSGDFILEDNATLRLASTNSLLQTINNYNSYDVKIESITEFYGSNQTISDLPVNLLSGLGFCILNNAGTKLVDAPLIIRRDLTISNDATLLNNVGVNSLEVRGSIFNNANIDNSGVIQIGQ